MKKIFTSTFLFLCIVCCKAQNSVLINFGSNTCVDPNAPVFSLINNPLSGAPSVLADCDMSAQVPNISNVFIAYNPRNNKVYIADVRSLTSTNIWVLDMGLPQNISCPAIIPVVPTYSYSYISNNFEFDNNGDLWSFSNYNSLTGRCSMDKFDVNTGAVINTRILQFPVGNFPTNIGNGDLTILPNGRMFATLGTNPSQLYEINNYSSSSGGASATYLQTLPNDCFGIAYLNGQLELTGIDNAGCYYFDYNISTNTLGAQKPFQIGQAAIDNTSLTPSVGTTKQLVNAVKVNANTADLTYEVHVKNLGNVIVNNINATDDLAAVFGASNISNVATSFVAGANAAGLTLNAAYNGTTVTSLLNSGQNLPNQTSTTNNYFFKVLIQCRVTNLNPATIYLNSAIGTATIGNSANASLINISDSSNNGTQAVVDPNNNGNASEAGENIPTPFNFAVLPVHFINVSASLVANNSALVKWAVATPTINAKHFEVEYSGDGISWTTLSQLGITDPNKGSYQFTHLHIPPGSLFYRIKEIDNDGSYIYSRVVLLHNKLNGSDYIVQPNPGNNYLRVTATGNVSGKVLIELYDAVGRKMLSKQMLNSTEDINTSGWSEGTYVLKISTNGKVDTHRVLIVH
ncbi:MAG: T9SS type A sorting domain-containing protein [Ferruginibacter sp.]